MLLSDLFNYYSLPGEIDDDYITKVLVSFFKTVCKVDITAIDKDMARGFFVYKYPNLEVKKEISQHFEKYNIYKDSELIKQSRELYMYPIINYTFRKEYEKYCHLAMVAGLVYNTSGKIEDYKYSPIQNYNIQSERTVVDSFGERKDTTTHAADSENYVNGKRSQSSTNTLESSQQTDTTNGERGTSNYDTSMENETPKLSSKQTNATSIDSSKFQDVTSGTNVVNSDEFTDTISKQYGDISTTMNEYSNTHHEEYSEIGDKSLRPTAEVLKNEIDIANYTRFLDTVYTDCILALCETTVW